MVQAWYPAEASIGAQTGFRTRVAEEFNLKYAAYQRARELTPRASYRAALKTHSLQDADIAPVPPHNSAFPVILYNAGWQGERTEGTYQAEELASHGFVVVAIDHTFFGGLIAFPDGRVNDSSGSPALGNFEHSSVEEQWALGGKFVHVEANDDIFVVDQLQGMNEDRANPFFHSLDLSRVGAMGFSIGGAVAAQTAYQDPRVKAALNLDGWTFGDVAQNGLAKPLMVIYEDRSETVPTPAELHSTNPQERMRWEFSEQDYRNITCTVQANRGWLLFLAQTQHVDFTDRSLFSTVASWTGRGTLGPAKAHTIVNAYTLAFFSEILKGEERPLLKQQPSPYPEVEIVDSGQSRQ